MPTRDDELAALRTRCARLEEALEQVGDIRRSEWERARAWFTSDHTERCKKLEQAVEHMTHSGTPGNTHQVMRKIAREALAASEPREPQPTCPDCGGICSAAEGIAQCANCGWSSEDAEPQPSAERSDAVMALIRVYLTSYQREGWEEGETEREAWEHVADVLANAGYATSDEMRAALDAEREDRKS